MGSEPMTAPRQFHVDMLCIDTSGDGQSFELLDSFATFEAAQAAAERFTAPSGHAVDGAVISSGVDEANGTVEEDGSWTWQPAPDQWTTPSPEIVVRQPDGTTRPATRDDHLDLIGVPKDYRQLWTATVRFRTPYALSQDTAQAFWARGDEFHRKGGAKTYEWTAQIMAPDLTRAVAYLIGEVADVVAERERFTGGPEFLGVDADRVEEGSD